MNQTFIKLIDYDTYLNTQRIETIIQAGPNTLVYMTASRGGEYYKTCESAKDFIDRLAIKEAPWTATL
jgi:hypothetical protein